MQGKVLEKRKPSRIWDDFRFSWARPARTAARAGRFFIHLGTTTFTPGVCSACA